MMKYVFVLWCPGYIEIKMQQSMIQECPVTTAGFEDCGCDSTGAKSKLCWRNTRYAVWPNQVSLKFEHGKSCGLQQLAWS